MQKTCEPLAIQPAYPSTATAATSATQQLMAFAALDRVVMQGSCACTCTDHYVITNFESRAAAGVCESSQEQFHWTSAKLMGTAGKSWAND